MTFNMHRWFCRLAVGAAAALLLLTATTTSAQTGCVAEDLTAWAVNIGPSALFESSAVEIHIGRWSTELEKDRFARTLLDHGPEALFKALRHADGVGTIRTPTTFPDDIIFAWQELELDGARRIILVTDRPMVVWRESMRVAGNEDLFTVVELRVAATGAGEGKVAIGSNIAVDRSLDLIQLNDYDAAPLRLIDVQPKYSTR